MKQFAIITDTCSDLDKDLREQYGIDYVPMHYSVDGTDYVADLDWQHRSAKEFYDGMRAGKRFITAQVNASSYKRAFTQYASQGLDVLYIGCSSALSASVQSARLVAEEVRKEYPDRIIRCVDSLRACGALGILVVRAGQLKAEGKTLDEVAAWVEENKRTSNMEGTVDKLTYLKQAGRVSAASAFFGGLLNIKPIIIADALGRNFAVEKVKSRKTSLERLAQRVAERYEDVAYQNVFIEHADCEADALELKGMIEEKLGKTIDAHICYVGPIIGASVGPGMVSAHFFGKEVEVNK